MLFDLVNLVPFVRKHKVNPVTGEPMSSSDIIRLNMAKNSDGYVMLSDMILYYTFFKISFLIVISTYIYACNLYQTMALSRAFQSVHCSLGMMLNITSCHHYLTCCNCLISCVSVVEA